MVETLTPRQSQVFSYIKSYSKRNNYAPTYEEIGEAMGLSSMATVYNHIKVLEKKGYIKRQKGVARGIDILIDEEKNDRSLLRIPVLGRVIGNDELKEGGAEEETLQIAPRYLVDAELNACYALQVEGEGLISEGILSGDYLVLQYVDEPKEVGSYLLMVSEGEAVVRRVEFGNGEIRLKSASNPMLNATVNHADIHGKLLLVLRKY